MGFLSTLGVGTDSLHYGDDYFRELWGAFCDDRLLIRLRSAHTIFECLKDHNAYLSTDGRIKQLFNYFSDVYYRRLCMMVHSKNVIGAEYEIIDSVPDNRSHMPAFYFNLHLNSFYIHLAAILDNLAWVLNFLYELGFKEDAKNRSDCGLEKTKFEDKIRKKNANIANILRGNREWIISSVHVKRHPVAHRLSLGINTIINQSTGAVHRTLLLLEEGQTKIVTGNPVEVVEGDFNRMIEILSQVTDAVNINDVESLFRSGGECNG